MKKSIFLTSYEEVSFVILIGRESSHLALSCCLCRLSPQKDLCLVKHTHDDRYYGIVAVGGFTPGSGSISYHRGGRLIYLHLTQGER